jgi:hypothetical protein
MEEAHMGRNTFTKRKKIFLFALLSGMLLCSVHDLFPQQALAGTTTNQAKTRIDPLSARSLYLSALKGNEKLGSATGFIVSRGEVHYLVTNWHVVTGRSPQDDRPMHPEGKTPDALLISHHSTTLGNWVEKRERLFDENGTKRWLEHKNGRSIDVVALPLADVTDDLKIYSSELSLSDTDMIPEVGMPVYIIGFPFGLKTGFPIWKTGHIASEPEIDYDGEPLFLIDATTRPGMSGSPVFLRMSGGFRTRSGQRIMTQSGYSTLFLGVYSGRIRNDSEIGKVWRPRLISEIIERAVPPKYLPLR